MSSIQGQYIVKRERNGYAMGACGENEAGDEKGDRGRNRSNKSDASKLHDVTGKLIV